MGHDHFTRANARAMRNGGHQDKSEETTNSSDSTSTVTATSPTATSLTSTSTGTSNAVNSTEVGNTSAQSESQIQQDLQDSPSGMEEPEIDINSDRALFLSPYSPSTYFDSLDLDSLETESEGAPETSCRSRIGTEGQAQAQGPNETQGPRNTSCCYHPYYNMATFAAIAYLGDICKRERALRANLVGLHSMVRSFNRLYRQHIIDGAGVSSTELDELFRQTEQNLRQPPPPVVQISDDHDYYDHDKDG